MTNELNQETKNHLVAIGKEVVRNWSHNHRWDMTPTDYEPEMVGACDTCTERFESRIRRGKLCKKHPFSYFEKADANNPEYCEGCEGIDAKSDRAKKNELWQESHA